MNELRTFNEEVASTLKDKDGQKLCDLLQVESAEVAKASALYVPGKGSLPRPAQHPWHLLPDLVQNCFAARTALETCNWEECCTHLMRAANLYLKILSEDDAWSLPLLHRLCCDLRVTAERADKRYNKQENTSILHEYRTETQTDKVARVLHRAFSVTNNDRRGIEEQSRRAGILGVINQLLRVYFKCNKLHLCTNVVSAMHSSKFPDFETMFPLAQRVTYKFLVGRLHVLAGRNLEAIRDLTYAFERTPNRYWSNKRRVLLYLIPAKMLCGSLPSMTVLQTYGMTWFTGIIRALRNGDMGIFNDSLSRNREFFLKKALYFTIEKMRMLVYRALFRKVHIISGKHIVKIESFHRCLVICGVDIELGEAEQILAILVFNNLIRGYISNTKGVLVLSKKCAFPPPAILDAAH